MIQIEQKPSNFSGGDKPTWELYSTCIHCGLCLNHCPTYRELGVEMDSPRGRIYQVLQVDEGRLPLSDSFVTHIDRCLGCLACETACPSGVQYGRIVERARAQIEQNYRRGPVESLVRWFFYEKALRDFHVLAKAARVLRFYQRSGLRRLARITGILHLLGVADVERLAPEINTDFFFREIGMFIPAQGERRGTVAFHAGCVNHVAFADLNHATVRLLIMNGFDVHIMSKQRCCGALHAHTGKRETARLLARRNIDALLALGGSVEALITNSAGCGSMLKEYDDLLADDPEYAEKARLCVRLAKDVTEFLAEKGLREPRRKLQQRVTYQDPCHLAHAQRIRTAPRDLLRAAGAEIVEMPNSDQCCGSAGTYNVIENELSMKILKRKMEDISTVAERSDVIATANTGCMLQLRAGVEAQGTQLPVRHVVEILNDCY
jgi:glycolate oxidase iron-sulfur subunit